MNAAHAKDTNHPVVLNHYGYYPRSAKPYLYPAITADIHGFDIYPVIFSSGKACEDPAPHVPGNFQQCAPQFRHYFHVMDEFRRWDYGLSPWIPIIENGNEASRGRSASPTPAQFRMEAWLNIIHGAKGLAYWPAQDWGTVPRDILPEMGALAKTTAALKDAILGDVTARTVVSNRTVTGSRVDAMVRQTPGYIWVFAARLTDFGEENAAPLTTQLTVSEMNGTQAATVYGEDRTVQVVNGVLTDTFAPYAVHIYQIPYGPAAPKLESVQVK